MSTAKLRRYAWNEENWLKAVVDGGGQNVTRFLYDSSGDRVVKVGQSGTSITVGQFFAVKNGIYATKHIFAGETRLVSKLEPLRRTNETGEDEPPGEVQDLPGCVPSEYTPRKCYAPAVAVATDGSSSPANFRPMTYYYHPDHLGSTSWLTDQYGDVQERVEYYPYGEVWRDDREQRRGNLRRTQSFLFTSKEFDEETGLSYFGARYYDSRRGRWLTTDPITPIAKVGRPQSSAPYSYGALSPVRYVDPNGADDWDIVQGMLVGFAQGVIPGGSLFGKPGGGRMPADFNKGWGAGMIIAGVAELYVSAAFIIDGSVAGTGGTALTATVAGAPLGVPVAAVGGVMVVGGVAVGVDAYADLTMGVNAYMASSAGTGNSGGGSRQTNRIPDRGEPGAVVSNPSGTTTKKYGPDGWVQKEFNKGHTGKPEKTPAEEQLDHIHDYKPNPFHPDKKPTRMPGREPRKQDLAELGRLEGSK